VAISRFLFALLLLGFGLTAYLISGCETVDIEPVVTITFDSTNNGRISENKGVAIVNAVLNGKTKEAVSLNFVLSGSAMRDTDFRVSGLTINIPAGQLSGSVQIDALDNAVAQGDKTIVITLSDVSKAIALAVSDTIIISDDDTDTDGDGISDASDFCPTLVGLPTNNGCPSGYGILINEVLYDPSNVGLDGDANRDGVYNQNQDEFIELYNDTPFPQDISNFTISRFIITGGTTEERYRFPLGTLIGAKKALVIFGGGTPTGAFGGSNVLVSTNSTGLGLSNSGQRIYFMNSDGAVLQSFDSDVLSDNPNESYTRSPDITGPFEQHGTIVPTVLFSPGTKLDGSTF
jgi:hypothetical protein